MGPVASAGVGTETSRIWIKFYTGGTKTSGAELRHFGAGIQPSAPNTAVTVSTPAIAGTRKRPVRN